MGFLIAFGAGALVGVVYVAIRVKSPAPPVLALIGLAGIWIAQTLLDRLT